MATAGCEQLKGADSLPVSATVRGSRDPVLDIRSDPMKVLVGLRPRETCPTLLKWLVRRL